MHYTRMLAHAHEYTLTHTHTHTLRDQRVGVSRTNLYCVFSSQRLIEWWCEEKDVSNRAEGVTLGKELYATGILKHGMCYRRYHIMLQGSPQDIREVVKL